MNYFSVNKIDVIKFYCIYFNSPLFSSVNNFSFSAVDLMLSSTSTLIINKYNIGPSVLPADIFSSSKYLPLYQIQKYCIYPIRLCITTIIQIFDKMNLYKVYTLNPYARCYRKPVHQVTAHTFSSSRVVSLQ